MTACSEQEQRLSISSLELFEGVPASIVAHIEKECTWQRYYAHETILENESQRPHGVYFLVKGEVEILKYGTRDQQQSVASLSAPDCFGEFGAVTGQPGSASVRTTTPCVVAEISSERFLELLDACPAASLYLLKKTVSLIKNLGDDSVMFHSAGRVLEAAHRNAILRSL